MLGVEKNGPMSIPDLQKRSKTRTETQTQNEHAFIDHHESLFAIAHLNALELITIEDNRQFWKQND